MEMFPPHFVSAWIGNSHVVPMKHYLQVTDARFELPAADPEALHNPVQHPGARAKRMALAIAGDGCCSVTYAMIMVYNGR